MQYPTLLDPCQVAPDTYSLPAYLPVPGAGVLPVNAFLIQGAEPVLVDTGLAALQEDFLQSLSQLVDLVDLAWIWLTHTDPDHVGNLARVLAAAPRARIVTTFLGMGKLGLHQLPTERVYLVNPGQELAVCDRTLLAISPPTYDAPETTGLFDPRTRTLFSSDCFGALMARPAATAQDLAPADLRDGLVAWTMVDAPWLSMVDAQAFDRSLEAIRQLRAEVVLSSHLPPAPGMVETLLTYLQAARLATPTPGPDQAALEQMMAQMLAA